MASQQTPPPQHTHRGGSSSLLPPHPNQEFNKRVDPNTAALAGGESKMQSIKVRPTTYVFAQGMNSVVKHTVTAHCCTALVTPTCAQ